MRALMRVTALVTSIALIGCGSAEAFDEPGSVIDPGPAPSEPEPTCINVDPSGAGPNSACGVFVSSTLGSDDNPGTLAKPVRTIARALALALDGARRVYACAELFHEPAEIPAGVELWGGLDCADGWRYVGTTKKTTIAPGEPGGIALRFLPGDGLARVIDVRAEAVDGIEPSQSLIAALVLPGASVEIVGSELVAGHGAPGADGEQGGGPGAPPEAQAGADGINGSDVCGSSVNQGGASVVTVCDGIVSTSGKGGNGRETYGEDAGDGEPWPYPNEMGFGKGGYGQNSGWTQCMSGQVGLAGQDGEHGLGGVGLGLLTLDGWEGHKGQDGGKGLPGQGGGGGGGVRGPLYNECGAGQPKGGASGGSGGAGGCGGEGGKGGGYGGSSIGLISLSDAVTVRSTTITTDNGGNGGRGGIWQGGGAGGRPGAGGWGGIGTSIGGCRGADGGKGGNGGHGGGGLGGMTLGIAHAHEKPPTLDEVTTHTGKAGKGGLGGSPFVTIPGTTGEDGLAAATQGFPAP